MDRTIVAAGTDHDGHRASAALRWPQTSAPWAGLAIITMWLAVLLVGLFGGDIVTETVGTTRSTVPSSVAVALIALIATIFVARWGFGSAARIAALEAELDDERRRREAIEQELDGLRRVAPGDQPRDPH